MHIVVIGAGITGLSTAWTLAQAGMQVSVVERAATPAQGASAQNGAQLSYAYVAPLASPDTLRSVPAMLLQRDSPLRFRPGLSRRLWAWCVRFMRACNAAEVERSTRALLELGALSRERFEGWRCSLPNNVIDHAPNGKLVLLRDAQSWQSAQRQLELQAPWGPPQFALSAQECLRTEPALEASEEPLFGGIHTPSEAVADCARVCEQLAASLQEQGHAVRWNEQALGWQQRGGKVCGLQVQSAGEITTLQADAYVVANGVAAPDLLNALGVRLPIVALRGYSIELQAQHLRHRPRLSITDSARKIVFAPLGSDPASQRLRVAGMAELGGRSLWVDPGRIAQLLDASDRLFGLRQPPDDVRPWVGQRPITPTGRPCIGRLPNTDNVFVNAGQGALGFTLAFGSAALLLAQLRGAALPMRDSTAFSTGLA